MEEVLKSLFKKYLKEELTSEEASKLLGLLNDESQQDKVDQILYQHFLDSSAYSTDLEAYQKIKQAISAKTSKPKAKIKTIVRFSTVAAACILAIIFGVKYFNQNDQQDKSKMQVAKMIDIAPGKKGGSVSFDGVPVSLEVSKLISVTKNSSINYKDGVLNYQNSNAQQDVKYTTVATPKGRELKVILPDGSQAWLNSASTLKFPTKFSGNERVVELTGEAFFDVTHDSAHAFIVKVVNEKISNTQIKVLGTRFNVNAYNNNDEIKATLESGRVNVTSNQNQQNLLPGQQVLIPVNTQQISKPFSVETDIVSSWKDGFFKFDNEPISEILKTLERWYDITIVYDSKISNKTYNGTLSKSLTLRNVLTALQNLGLNFSIDDRTLHVASQ